MLNKKKFLVAVEASKYGMVDLSQNIKISGSKILLSFSSNLYKQNLDIYQHVFLLESIYKKYKKHSNSKNCLKINFPYLRFKEELFFSLSTLLKPIEHKDNLIIFESEDIENDLSIIKNIIEKDSYCFLRSLYKAPVFQLIYEKGLLQGHYLFTLDWLFTRVNILNKRNLSEDSLKKLTNNLNFIADKINNNIKIKLKIGGLYTLFQVKYFNEIEKIFREAFKC